MTSPVATRDEIAARLRAMQPGLDSLGVASLALFGSAARDELGPASDVDILVEFRGPPRFDAYMDLKLALEERLGRRVDLLTPGALRPAMRAVLARDLVRVA
jgi:predicted nucleotidyltransferase